MIRNLTVKAVSTLILCIPIGNGLQAQEDTAKLASLTLKDLLTEKVTTASKTLQEIGLAPSTMVLVTKEQIRSRGYQSLLDLMYDLPDVKVDDKMYAGIRNSVTVRGAQGSEKFMILIDGIVISSPSGEAMAIMENYPVHVAEQVEIVFGPASALYGANAVSGVINIITKAGNWKKKTRIETSSVAGSYGYTNTTLLISKKINDHVSFLVSGQYSYDKGVDYSKIYKDDTLLNVSSYSTGIFNTIYGPATPVTPVRPRYESPMSAYNIYGALYMDEFTFSIFRNYFKTPTGWGNNTQNAIFNKDVFMAQSVSTGTAAFKKTYGKITTATSVSGSEYNLNPRSNYRNMYTGMEPGYKYSSNFMYKAEQQIDYKPSEELSFTIGAGYEKYNAVPQSGDLANPVNKKENIRGTYLGTSAYYRPEGLEAQFYFIKYYNIGSYFQTQYSPSRKMHITAGARYDINSRYGGSFNPRVGIVFTPGTKTTIKALYSSAFLAPTPSFSYVQYGSFETNDSGRTYHSDFLHLPNPGLKPIRSQNAEVSIRQYISDNFSLNLDAYYTALSGLYEFSDDNETTNLYHNMFNGIPVDYIAVFVNESKQKNYGGSLKLQWKHSIKDVLFNSYASLSYVNGYIYDPVLTGNEVRKQQLDFISPLMFRMGTDMKAGKFSFSPRLLVMSRQHIAGHSYVTASIAKRQTIPGYALLNLSLRYNTSKSFSIFCNVSNALDQKYRSVSFNMDLTKTDTEFLHGQPQDPIRVISGFQYNF